MIKYLTSSELGWWLSAGRGNGLGYGHYTCTSIHLEKPLLIGLHVLTVTVHAVMYQCLNVECLSLIVMVKSPMMICGDGSW